MGEIVATVKGKDLVGLSYEPLFPYYKSPSASSLSFPRKRESSLNASGTNSSVSGLESHEEEQCNNGFKIYAADFVNTEEGTGIVHIAPAFGEDDLNLGKEKNLPFIQHINMDGTFKEEVVDFAGLTVKPIADEAATDKKIVAYLEKRGLLFSQELYRHSYPHCWRCESPLLNYSTSSYFVAVTKIKEQLLSQARDIRWAPAHIKEGRFGQWLQNSRDWSISRQRFWGSVIPIWKCQKNPLLGEEGEGGGAKGNSCGHIAVIGSIAELEKLSGQKVKDLHKHFVDDITFPCSECGGVMRRIPDVLDCWFESGAMPYAAVPVPMLPKPTLSRPDGTSPLLPKGKAISAAGCSAAGWPFPAQFIAEGVDQTRAWFYYLHVLGVALFGKASFQNVAVNGIVLAEDGQKMSKRLQNYPDPAYMFDKYGADAVRYYLACSPVMRAEDLRFSEKGAAEAVKKVLLTLYNVLAFYKMYAGENPKSQIPNSKQIPITKIPKFQTTKHILDRWILSKLNVLIRDITAAYEAYDLNRATRPLGEFINELSTWFVRRSRGRFKGEDGQDKSAALATLGLVLSELSKLMAPVMPFTAEHVWREVKCGRIGELENWSESAESVHLQVWPAAGEIDRELLTEMEKTRQFAETIHSLRAQAGIKVRQPLAEAIINAELAPELEQILKEETNVQLINQSTNQPINQSTPWIVSEDGSAALNSALTKELRLEGHLRELIRQINALRKKRGLTPGDKVAISYQTNSSELKKVFIKFADELKRAVIASEIREEANEGQEMEVNGEKARIMINRN